MENPDLIAGLPNIAHFLGCKQHRAEYLARKGHLPIFKIGGKWCLRPASYEKFCADREKVAMMVTGD